MVKSAVIEFVEASEAINGLVTKFGGEPCWLDRPRWPLSRRLGVPMSFLCQVALTDVPGLPQELSLGKRMAFIFMTEAESTEATWDPEGGENAVVIQPGSNHVAVQTVEAATYVVAREMSKAGMDGPVQEVRADVAVRLTMQGEPEIIDAETGLLGFTIGPATDHIDQTTQELLWADKLGGVPSFWQGCEYPLGEAVWHLFLQLNDGGELFDANFGTGRAFAFISADGMQGRLLWQC